MKIKIFYQEWYQTIEDFEEEINNFIDFVQVIDVHFPPIFSPRDFKKKKIGYCIVFFREVKSESSRTY